MAQRNGSLISLPDFALPPAAPQHLRPAARESSLPPFNNKDASRNRRLQALPPNRSSFGREMATPIKEDYYYYYKKRKDFPLRRASIASSTATAINLGAKLGAQTFNHHFINNSPSFLSQLSTTTNLMPERWSNPRRKNRRRADGRSRSVDDLTSVTSRVSSRCPSSIIHNNSMPYFQRPGPLLAAMAHDYEKQRRRQRTPYYYPRAMMWRPVAPLPCPPVVEQPGGAVANDVLSPIASRSMLTCSKEFRAQFPNVYAGLCKGLLDVNRLVQHEVVVPIKEEIAIHKDAIRSRRAVTAVWSEHLWRPLHGRFPDPSIAPKLIRRLCDYFWNKIEVGIRAAEDERSFLQWLFRFDVENAMDIRVTTSLGAGMNSALANIEGVAHVKRHKGALMGILRPDTLQLDIDLVVKALFLNGGQLAEINDDPIFIDRVQEIGRAHV